MTECTLCHSGTYREKRVVFKSKRDGRLMVVEDVPARVCDTCGDEIISLDTALEIERVLEGEPAYSSPIYRFPAEAASPGGDG